MRPEQHRHASGVRRSPKKLGEVGQRDSQVVVGADPLRGMLPTASRSICASPRGSDMTTRLRDFHVPGRTARPIFSTRPGCDNFGPQRIGMELAVPATGYSKIPNVAAPTRRVGFVGWPPRNARDLRATANVAMCRRDPYCRDATDPVLERLRAELLGRYTVDHEIGRGGWPSCTLPCAADRDPAPGSRLARDRGPARTGEAACRPLALVEGVRGRAWRRHCGHAGSDRIPPRTRDAQAWKEYVEARRIMVGLAATSTDSAQRLLDRAIARDSSFSSGCEPVHPYRSSVDLQRDRSGRVVDDQHEPELVVADRVAKAAGYGRPLRGRLKQSEIDRK